MLPDPIAQGPPMRHPEPVCKEWWLYALAGRATSLEARDIRNGEWVCDSCGATLEEGEDDEHKILRS